MMTEVLGNISNNFDGIGVSYSLLHHLISSNRALNIFSSSFYLFLSIFTPLQCLPCNHSLVHPFRSLYKPSLSQHSLGAAGDRPGGHDGSFDVEQRGDQGRDHHEEQYGGGGCVHARRHGQGDVRTTLWLDRQQHQQAAFLLQDCLVSVWRDVVRDWLRKRSESRLWRYSDVRHDGILFLAFVLSFISLDKNY